MPYTINKTNGQLFAVIADGTIDTTSRLKLIGKNVTSFGEIQNQNYIQLLESGANVTAPTAPLVGELWFDNSSAGILKVYNGSEFRDLAVSTVTSTPPPVPIEGDIWYDTANSQLNVFDGTNYVLVGPLFTSTEGTSGPVVKTISDGTTNHVVTVLYSGTEMIAIISKDATFTPSPAIPGFATLGPGMQLSTNIAGLTPDFIGNAITASNADNAALLDNLDSTQFLRSDIGDTTTGSLGVLNDNGISVGVGADLSLRVELTGNVVIENTTLDHDITLITNTGGIATAVITIDGTAARARVSPPLTDTDISNKKYVDDADAIITTSKVSRDGSLAMTGNLDMATNRVTNAADPVDLQDTATKNYILNLVFGSIYTVGSYFFGPDPTGKIPGTWAQVPSGTFLMASATGFGATGGSNTKTISLAEMPTHNHGGGDHYHANQAWTNGTKGPYGGGGGWVNPEGEGDPVWSYAARNVTSGTIIANNGSGAAKDWRPQYESVEVWKRVA